MFQGVSTRVILIATGCALLWARPYAGQVTPGRLEERVPSSTDTSQAFALYLPPGYTAERRWPVLFVLDPRGRALLARDLFRDAAARLGWVAMSSYNTRSDALVDPNLSAMDAMLISPQTRV